MDKIKAGIKCEANEKVTPAKAASHIGSGTLSVYSTPSMIAFIERTCMELIEPYLPQGHTSVGVQVRVRHLAPTPLGSTVRVRVEITGVERGQVAFKAQVLDETEIVGEGEHLRAVIDEERFLQRVMKKKQN